VPYPSGATVGRPTFPLRRVFFQKTAKPTPVQALQRFEHYELVTGEGGKPVELGRGAMGVTYKAFDLDLRCPVTLKVISEKYLGDCYST
jgi:hypothetical protein